jgi:hypothetical protein
MSEPCRRPTCGEFGEPWILGLQDCKAVLWYGNQDVRIGQLISNDAIAERILACVNACEGIPSENLVRQGVILKALPVEVDYREIVEP